VVLQCERSICPDIFLLSTVDSYVSPFWQSLLSSCESFPPRPRCFPYSCSSRSPRDVVRLTISFSAAALIHRSIYSECATQQYIFSLTEGNASAPRVPKNYDCFAPDNRMGYIVMEYVQASSTLAQNVPEKVANALQWLRGLAAPSDTAIGSVPGRDADYMLLKGFTAPIVFSSIEAIERYMNKVRLCLPPLPNHSPPANNELN
jgi:hypothetical protein